MKRKTLGFLGVVLILGLSTFHLMGCASQSSIKMNDQEIQELQTEANSLRSNGQYEAAAQKYRQLVIERPRDDRAHKNLAFCLSELDRYEEALKSAKEAVRLNPKSTDNQYELAYALGKLKRSEEELKVYEEILRLDPKMSIAYNGMAYPLIRLGRLEEALVQVNKAIELSPKSASYYDTRGDVLVRMKNYKGALEDYRKSVNLDKKELSALKGICVTANFLGYFEESIKAYERAKDIEKYGSIDDDLYSNKDLDQIVQASREDRVYQPVFPNEEK